MQDPLDEAGGGRDPKLAPGVDVPIYYGEAPIERIGPAWALSADPNTETGPDAMTQYTAAASLYQEVQLLNRAIRDAAIPAGFRPYMVRLQVSLMPTRRHAPYDAYTTLSFFVSGSREGSDEGSSARAPLRTTDDEVFTRPFGDGPKVLPLLVTDNLEASVESHSLDRLRTLLLSFLDYSGNEFIEPMISGMLHDAIRDQVLGRDLNSLLTVARLSENTLRIRLGAAQEATSTYAMVPRNHNVTLLLMVPEGAPPLMEVVSKTVLVDADNGEELAPADEASRARVFERFRAHWDLQDLSRAQLHAMHALARQNDQRAFAQLLRASLPPEHPALAVERSIWIELVSLAVDDQYDSNLFELPGQGEDVAVSSEVFERQTVVVEDDGFSSHVVLREARFPDFEQILAVLRVRGADPEVVLPAESVELDLSRRELHVDFPSLERWSLVEAGAEPLPLDLDLTWAGQERSFQARLVRVEPALVP